MLPEKSYLTESDRIALNKGFSELHNAVRLLHDLQDAWLPVTLETKGLDPALQDLCLVLSDGGRQVRYQVPGQELRSVWHPEDAAYCYRAVRRLLQGLLRTADVRELAMDGTRQQAWWQLQLECAYGGQQALPWQPYYDWMDGWSQAQGRPLPYWEAQLAEAGQFRWITRWPLWYL